LTYTRAPYSIPILNMVEKLKKLVKNYRERINPPYSRQDLPAILSTLGLILAVLIVALYALNVQNDSADASGSTQIVFVDTQTLQPIKVISGPTVKVLLSAPWPVAALLRGEVAAASDTKDTKNNPTKGHSLPMATKVPKDPATTIPPVRGITTSIVLAEDVNFTQNVLTITPVTSIPLLASYTFSNSTLGRKVLHAKFVSSLGNILTYSNSIDLVTLNSISPTPISNVPLPSIVPIGTILPFTNAPLCPDSAEAHNYSTFHTLWDSVRGCHYDHEHGQNPFTSAVTDVFPSSFNLYSLLGNVGVGHTNPSGPMENTHKHGGFKWNVQLAHPEGCIGFEGARNGVNGSVIQFHGFGDYSIEAESRVHSTTGILRQCNTANPTDYGYIFFNQFQDYGQRIVPYQGTIFPYPNQPAPAYDSPRGPYLSMDCVDQTEPHAIQCRTSLQDVLRNNRATSSNWAAKPNGINSTYPFGSKLFTILWRVRDIYQLIDWEDQVYPFTFLWLCSSDGGITFNPAGCKYNNTTTQINEIAGEIPSSWDNLAGFDSNPQIGRITAAGFVTRFGDLHTECEVAGTDCHPIKLENAFVGKYGSVLIYTTNKGTNVVPASPDRDIFFCGHSVCNENDNGAVPSGWVGQNN
jgi:hypothetical protein